MKYRAYNIRGYESHLIIKEISKFDVKVNVTPIGLEKYTVFIINTNLVFIDRMQFMNFSLHSLVKNLSDNDFKYLSEELSGKFLKQVKQKVVYPYEYMDSFKRFSENKLPDRYRFFSSLKDVCISDKDYLKASNIWNVFKMNTMGDCHDLYLKADVLLLADVVEKFTNTCLDYYGSDPCHYISSHGLIWDAMLKISEIKLDALTCIYLLKKE